MKCRRTKTWIDENGKEHRDIVWFGSYGLNTEGSDYEVYILNHMSKLLIPDSVERMGVKATVDNNGILTINGQYKPPLLTGPLFYDKTRMYTLNTLVSAGKWFPNNCFGGMDAQGYSRGIWLSECKYEDDKLKFTVLPISTETPQNQSVYRVGASVKMFTHPGATITLKTLTGTNLSASFYSFLLKDDLTNAGESVTFNKEGNGLFYVGDEAYTGIRWDADTNRLYFLNADDEKLVFDSNTSPQWVDEKYRAIIFYIYHPYGDYREWLEVHSSTFEKSGTRVIVSFFNSSGVYSGSLVNTSFPGQITVPSVTSTTINLALLTILCDEPRVETVISDITVDADTDLNFITVGNVKGNKILIGGYTGNNNVYIYDSDNGIDVKNEYSNIYTCENELGFVSFNIRLSAGQVANNLQIKPLLIDVTDFYKKEITDENVKQLIYEYQDSLIKYPDMKFYLIPSADGWVNNDNYGKALFYNPNDIHDNYAEKQEGVATSLQQRLSVLKGELWYQVNYGLPLFDKNKSKTILDSYIASIIMAHPDIVSILEFNSEKNDNHVYSCWFRVLTTYGEMEMSI